MQNSASTYNPLSWLRQKLTADRREKESKEDILAAKAEAREEGQLSLFEQTKSVHHRPEAAAAKKPASVASAKVEKPKKSPPTSVCAKTRLLHCL